MPCSQTDHKPLMDKQPDTRMTSIRRRNSHKQPFADGVGYLLNTILVTPTPFSSDASNIT